MNSIIHLILIDKIENKTIINDNGLSSCIEVAGKYNLLIK